MPPLSTWLIAQSNAAPSGVVTILAWSMLLLGAVVLGFILVLWFKRWMSADDIPSSAPAAGFTLNDLRELHRRGEISDEEYEQTRQRMIGAAKAQTADLPDPLAGRRAMAPSVPRAASVDPAVEDGPDDADKNRSD